MTLTYLLKSWGRTREIAKNKEDYISFSVDIAVDKYEKEKLIELRSIDGFKFMPSSLDSLTKNLVSSG